MILDNIEITVADCLLNLSRARSSKTLPPKKRFHDCRAYENRQSKRSKMNACEGNQLLDDCKGIISRNFYLGEMTLNSQAQPASPTTRSMYPIGQQQTHPFSLFSGYRKDCSVEAAGGPCVVNTDAVISTAQKMLEAPVSPGSKTGSESEPIEDVEFEEASRSASVVSDNSIHDMKDIETSVGGTLNSEIEPTCDDVLIGTGRTCSSHEGNKRFHREIYESCEEYFRADYKKGIVEKIINSVHKRGGRFLAGTKKGPWRLVADMDRLERNTRKSFHMAKKQREKELQVSTPSRKIAALTDLSPQHGQQVAVYVPEARSFCTGWIEKKRANGELFVRFSDRRLGAQWLNVVKTDIRIFSR